MAANPFATPGEWLRCALHAHTTNSDGELAPTLLARHYARAGFDVLAITDHHVRTVEPSTENLLIIPSTELDARVGGTDRDTHVLAFGVSAEPAPRGGELLELDEIVRWVRNDGGVPFLAHSYWSGLRTVDFEACEGLVGIEIYNAGCELETGRGLATLHWDEALEAGHHLLGIATDDCHHPGFDSSLAWVWVRSARAVGGIRARSASRGSVLQLDRSAHSRADCRGGRSRLPLEPGSKREASNSEEAGNGGGRGAPRLCPQCARPRTGRPR